MVHEDVAIAARKMHIYWRARRLYASAEPHLRPRDGVCEEHWIEAQEEARRQEPERPV